jgi:hypothetical protein
MPDQTPAPDRFKAEMPAIPGVAGTSAHARAGNIALRLVGGLLAALLVIVAASRFLNRKHSDPAPVETTPQIQVPAPPPDPDAGIPTVTDGRPAIAQTSEMAKPWSAKEFFYRDSLTGENTRALLIRLPAGSPNQSNGYWGLVMNAAYGNCKLEYITNIEKIRNDYDYRGAKHPMVGNPCSRTLFDPTRLMSLPGDIWVRGAIAQGSDLRPPLGIQVEVRGKDIVALRRE